MKSILNFIINVISFTIILTLSDVKGWDKFFITLVMIIIAISNWLYGSIGTSKLWREHLDKFVKDLD